MIAAMMGCFDMTNILLQGEYIDFDIKENVGCLFYALFYTLIIHNILDVDVQHLSFLQSGGWSALHFSAENGDSATTYSLIKAGANVHIKDKV